MRHSLVAKLWSRGDKEEPSKTQAVEVVPRAPSQDQNRAVQVPPKVAPSEQDDLLTDLMQQIGKAIDVWSRKHGLSNLPPDVVFEQALMALNEVHRLATEQAKRVQ